MCRGYYVDTAGKNTKKIEEDIKNQLKTDQLREQLTFDVVDPFKGSQVKFASGRSTNAFKAWFVIQAFCAACEKTPAMPEEDYYKERIAGPTSTLFVIDKEKMTCCFFV